MKKDWVPHVYCVAGASSVQNIKNILMAIGFAQIKINLKEESGTFIRTWLPDSHAEDYVVSATIEAIKP